jgi:predicted PurR-regulated permease PerM
VNRLVRDLPLILRNMEDSWVAPLDERFNSWLAEFIPLPEPEPVSGPDATGKAPNGVERPEPLPAPDGGAVVKLVEDYTYVVRRLDENRFEVIPRRRGAVQSREPNQKWDFSRQISAAFGQFRYHFENNIVELLQLSRRYVQAIVSSVFTTFLVLMTSAFILLDPQRAYRFVCSLVPRSHQPKVEQLIARLDHGLAGVVRGQVMICLVNGTLTGIGIAVIGVPYVITLTLIATLFSLIPIFGVLISTIPIMLLALTVSFTTALLALIWILGIHFFEGNILNPKIMGDSSRIHPVLIIFALVAGQYMAGILGALVAVPILSLVQNSFLFLKGLAEEVEAAT